MARDLFHDAVREALENDGWKITHDPLPIRLGGVDLYIDLGAEKLIAAEKEGRKIAVEIKSFVNVSALHEFHLAVGQYRNYLLALSKEDPERILFLAVPEDTYERFFTLPFVQDALEFNAIDYLIYDVSRKAISKWAK